VRVVGRVVSCRVVSCRVVSCRVVSCRVVSCRVVSCRVIERVWRSRRKLTLAKERQQNVFGGEFMTPSWRAISDLAPSQATNARALYTSVQGAR
jgi:hypothetical protein